MEERLLLRLTFVDLEGNEGVLSFRLAPSLPSSALLDFLDTVQTVVQPLSNASLVSATAYNKYLFPSPNEATIDADINAKLALFYRSDDIYEAIYIPAPRAEIFEATGIFAGIRVVASNEALVAFNAALVAFPEALATPEGTPFPLEYVVGGLAL